MCARKVLPRWSPEGLVEFGVAGTLGLRTRAARRRGAARGKSPRFRFGGCKNHAWFVKGRREMPHAPNPPYGAILYYQLNRLPSGEIKLQVFDEESKLVRTMSSIPPVLPERWPYPEYWVAKGSDLALPTKVGSNRTNWDLRYDDPPTLNSTSRIR